MGNLKYMWGIISQKWVWEDIFRNARLLCPQGMICRVVWLCSSVWVISNVALR